jgi:hypothetical protein
MVEFFQELFIPETAKSIYWCNHSNIIIGFKNEYTSINIENGEGK